MVRSLCLYSHRKCLYLLTTQKLIRDTLELNIWDKSFIIRSGPDTFKGGGEGGRVRFFGDLICVCGGGGGGEGGGRK